MADTNTASASTPATASPAPASAEAPAPATSVAADLPAGILSRDAMIAKAIAAGRAEVAAQAAPSVDPVADIPAPPQAAVSAVTEEQPAIKPAEEAKPDPMAAILARLDAQEKQNAALLERLTELTAKPEPTPQPEVKPEQKPAERTLTDSPFEAQAKVYFGDLPKPLLSQATEVLEKRHSWQMELRAAESAAQSGDVAAKERLATAQYALGKVQAAIEQIEFNAELARQVKQPAPAMSWGVTARDMLVDNTLAARSDWPESFQALEDHEVAAVLRGVPAGSSQDDYFARAEKALTTYASKRQQLTQPAAPAQTTPPAAQRPKNPAPPAAPKPETGLTGPVWENDKIYDKHEYMRRIIARGRGDAPTN